MSNSLDPDQAQHQTGWIQIRPSVGHDLDPNCLQMLSADETNQYSILEVEPILGHLDMFKGTFSHMSAHVMMI